MKILRIWNIIRKTVAVVILLFCGLIFIKGNEKSIDFAFFLTVFAMVLGFGSAKNTSNTRSIYEDCPHYRVGSPEWNMRHPPYF